MNIKLKYVCIVVLEMPQPLVYQSPPIFSNPFTNMQTHLYSYKSFKIITYTYKDYSHRHRLYR
jgi:hypothetical protein